MLVSMRRSHTGRIRLMLTRLLSYPYLRNSAGGFCATELCTYFQPDLYYCSSHISNGAVRQTANIMHDFHDMLFLPTLVFSTGGATMTGVLAENRQLGLWKVKVKEVSASVAACAQYAWLHAGASSFLQG